MRNNSDKTLKVAKSLLEQADNDWKRARRGRITHDYVTSIRSLQLVVELNFKALYCISCNSDNIKDLGHDICRVVSEAGKVTKQMYKKMGEDVLNADFQRVNASLFDSDPELKRYVEENPDLQNIMNADFDASLSKYAEYVWVNNDKSRPTDDIKNLFTDKPTEENLESYFNDLANRVNQLTQIEQKKVSVHTDNEILSFINISNIGMPDHTKKLEAGTIRTNKAISDFRRKYLPDKSGEKYFFYYYNFVHYPSALMLTLVTESVIIQGHQQSVRYPDYESPETTIPKNVYTSQNPVVRRVPELLTYSRSTLYHTKRFMNITEVILNNQKLLVKERKIANSKRTQKT